MIKLADPMTFRPFVVVTGSGTRFNVPHPDFIDIPPVPEEPDEEENPSYVIIYSGGASIPRMVVLENIQEIEFKPERQSGKKKSR